MKGFHYLLEAFGQIVKTYPDATLAVPGKSFLTVSRLRRTNYQKYLADLAEQYGVDVPEYRKIAEAVKKQTENK